MIRYTLSYESNENLMQGSNEPAASDGAPDARVSPCGANDAIAGRVLQEINRVNHAPAELVNENVAVSRLGCLLGLNRISSQRALTAVARFQIVRSEFGKHRRLAYVLVPMIGNPDSS